MKKLLISLAPLLAVVAFAVMPAMAQAETRSYGTCATGTPETKPPCKTGEHFTPFAEGVRIPVVSTIVSANFVLENEAETAGITCTTFENAGFVWNTAGDIGHSHLILVFDGCTGSGTLATVCKAPNIPNGNGIIEGVVTDEVISETEVEVTIESGFNVKCGTTELGDVTGKVKGTVVASKGYELEFVKAKGLLFAGEKSTITGTDATETTSGKKVYIN
ncbi:MAG: hypothetical protein ACLQBY_16655 [Solirubrobacteraceae bacterium]